MTKISVLLAQTPAPAGGNPLMQLLPLGFMLAAMYFILFAPQRKKQKEHDALVNGLKAGDEVLTTGGIYGVITSVKDDRFVVRIGENNAKVELGKRFVAEVVKKADSAA